VTKTKHGLGADPGGVVTCAKFGSFASDGVSSLMNLTDIALPCIHVIGAMDAVL
jgi:hypothetical protein